MSKLEKIVILGCGSYNPLTYMHLRMFEIARDFLIQKGSYEVVGGIISPVNDRYKTKKYLAPAKHRIEMIRLVLKKTLFGRPNWIRLDEWESQLDHWCRTIEVIQYHHKILNSNNNDKIRLMLICGSDMFDSFNVPNLWDDNDIETIIKDHGLLVIFRNTSDPWKTLRNSSKSHLLLKYESNIHIIEHAPNAVSSTYIRDAIIKKESIRYLTDDSIIEYIEHHKLYR
uniref:Nicotinamide-nucleotide adenylyltransferase n=1 Tax=Dermatophagoides pteronyssinus TaxID=6956 RepID=A0A6P6YDZ2_DERPT|nr:nicotinamide/nicotinic acid mononucleotide adenylyltransferase 3-like [Dermatophagoides pteronyssinus]